MSEEMLDIVDENDNVVGQCTRYDSYKRQRTNRIVFVIIKNREGKVAIQRRSYNCGFAPGVLDCSAGGHVSTGQEYFEAAERELFEEIGIKCKLKFLGKDYLDRKDLDKKYLKNMKDLRHKSHYHFRHVYEGTYDGEFSFDDGEVEELLFFSLKELRKMIDNGYRMTPSVVDILEQYYLN